MLESHFPPIYLIMQCIPNNLFWINYDVHYACRNTNVFDIVIFKYWKSSKSQDFVFISGLTYANETELNKCKIITYTS